jgi:hypothetical protein
VFDEQVFELRINQLISDGQEAAAERELLKALAEFRTQSDAEHLKLIHRNLAFFYAMPSTEDPVKAEQHFLEWERLSPAPYTLLQTATFYFYVLRDFSRTITKVDEIKARFDVIRNGSYYSALTLKGEALIELNHMDDANQVIGEMLAMLAMTKPGGQGRPCGDELNFLSAAASVPVLADRCREVLRIIIPRVVSPEYVERANSLLKRLQ